MVSFDDFVKDFFTDNKRLVIGFSLFSYMIIEEVDLFFISTHAEYCQRNLKNSIELQICCNLHSSSVARVVSLLTAGACNASRENFICLGKLF